MINMEMPLNLIWIVGRFCATSLRSGGGRTNRVSLHCGVALLVEVGI